MMKAHEGIKLMNIIYGLNIDEEFLSIVYISYTDNELLRLDALYGTDARS